MKREQHAKVINLEYIGEKIGTGVLMYFEAHKELLSSPEFNCAYKIAKDAYIKRVFSGVSVDLIEKFYMSDVEAILLSNSMEVIEWYKPDAYYLVDIVKRYNIASRYNDIFDLCNQW